MKHRNDIHIPTVEEIDDYMSKYDSESRYRRYSDWKKYFNYIQYYLEKLQHRL